MKRLSKILSIIILVMLTAFSIMQFHHHHCNGFAVSSVVEAIVEHEGCDDSDHHSSENDEHCGFHQDEAVEKRHILISSNEDTLKGLGFAVLTSSLCCCYCYSNSIDFCEIIQRIPLADINVVSNRGPPSAIFNHIFCKTLFNQKFRKWQRNYYMVYSA